MANYGERDPIREPLTAAHYDALMDASRQYHDLLADFDKAESCGIVCRQMRDSAASHAAQIQKVLGTYFPRGRPRD